MKCLQLLLVLIISACGKHDVGAPTYITYETQEKLRDSNSDQPQGIFIFSNLKSRDIFKLNFDLSTNSKDFFLRSLVDKNFKEPSINKLRLMLDPLKEKLEFNEDVSLTLEFHQSDKTHFPLALVTKDNKKIFKVVDRKLNLVLPKKTVNDILSNTAYFEYESEYTSISSNEYRILFFDGIKSEIIALDQRKTLEFFLEDRKIKGAQYFDRPEQLVFTPPSLNLEWWVKALSNGDKLVIKASTSELLNTYLSKFIFSAFNLVRSEGAVKTPLEITGTPGSRIFLKIRGYKHERKSSIEKVILESRNSRHIKCTIDFLKLTSAQGYEYISQDDLFESLFLEFEKQKWVSKDFEIFYQDKDTEGDYWIVSFSLPHEVTKLSLKTITQKIQATILSYNSCTPNNLPLNDEHKYVGKPVSPEIEMTLKIEVLVEDSP